MNNGRFIAAFTFLLLLFACTQSNHTPYKTFKKNNSIELPLQHREGLPPVKLKWHKFYPNTFSYIDYKNKKIRIHSLNRHRTIDSIDIDLHPHQYVQDYHFITPDSILLAFNPSFFGDYHDSILVIMNRKKEILETMSFVESPALLQNGKTSGSPDNWSYSDYTYFPLIYDKNNKFSYGSFATYTHEYCDSFVYQNPPVTTGKLYAKEDKPFKSISVNYPCYEKGSYYPINMKYLRGATDKDNNLLASLGNSSKMFYYYKKSDTTTQHWFPLSLIDTIKPKEKEYDSFWDYSKPEYLNIYRDSFRNGWWRVARLAVNQEDPPLIKNYPKYAIAFISDSFEIEFEGILPFGTKPPLLFKNNVILAYDAFNSEKQSKLILKEVELGKTYNNMAKYMNNYTSQLPKVSENTKIEFLRKTSNHKLKPSEKYVLLPIEQTCHSCLSEFQSFLATNNEMLTQRNVNLIIISSDEASIKKFINNINSDSLKFNIYSETSSTHLNYFEDWNHFKYLEIGKNKIQFERNYDPTQLYQLFEKLKGPSDK